VVIRIYGKFSLKSFILIIVDDIEPNDTQALFFSHNSIHDMCIETYSIKGPTTFLAKNVGNFMSSEQQFLTKFSTIFVNHVLNVAANEKLMEIHNKHIEG
jgi:hypothetical protein